MFVHYVVEKNTFHIQIMETKVTKPYLLLDNTRFC